MDNYVLELVNADQSYKLESLLLESYDHIVDIRGTKRAKTAQEIAELKQYAQVLRFLREHDKYKVSDVIGQWRTYNDHLYCSWKQEETVSGPQAKF